MSSEYDSICWYKSQKKIRRHSRHMAHEKAKATLFPFSFCFNNHLISWTKIFLYLVSRIHTFFWVTFDYKIWIFWHLETRLISSDNPRVIFTDPSWLKRKKSAMKMRLQNQNCLTVRENIYDIRNRMWKYIWHSQPHVKISVTFATICELRTHAENCIDLSCLQTHIFR